ncbi:hypothetical protein H9P43_008823 [Blastocladiella emersonii ATCC 22665]|nr:hypothetical protein H9P43_008823 [Blastocladiella emersonii ATCC 22665]
MQPYYYLPESEATAYLVLTIAGSLTCLFCLSVSVVELVGQFRKADRSHFKIRSCTDYDYIPAILCISSLAVAAVFACCIHAVAQPVYPVITEFYPWHSTVIAVEGSLLASLNMLIMLRRVKSVCIKKTWLVTIMTPVTVALAMAIFPVNLTVGLLTAEDVVRTNSRWEHYPVKPILLWLNGITAAWCIGCTLYAYRIAFVEAGDSGPSTPLTTRITTLLRGQPPVLTTTASALPVAFSSSSSTPSQPPQSPIDGATARNRPPSRQKLLGSIRNTYWMLTVVYSAGWIVMIGFLGAAETFMTNGLRNVLVALSTCGGILLEAQFRRIVRSRVSHGRRVGKRLNMHFEDTVDIVTAVPSELPNFADDAAMTGASTKEFDRKQSL